MTVGTPELHNLYYRQQSNKLYTYRSGAGILSYVNDSRFVCVESTWDKENCPGSFRLEAGISQLKFHYDNVFRKEWGWSREMFDKAYLAFKIYDRVLFQQRLSVHYALGVTRVGDLDVAKLIKADRDGVHLHD
jgi:hypothetical protein